MSENISAEVYFVIFLQPWVSFVEFAWGTSNLHVDVLGRMVIGEDSRCRENPPTIGRKWICTNEMGDAVGDIGRTPDHGSNQM
jgi:hypothetical protein